MTNRGPKVTQDRKDQLGLRDYVVNRLLSPL
jgi:hypothetical protein